MDPTRIPDVLRALERVWEGQPDLPLAAIWGELANRGVGWATSDAELLDHLEALHAMAPSLLDAAHPTLALVRTESPAYWLTVDTKAHTVVVRDPAGRVAPGRWTFAPTDSVRLNWPCTLTDTNGTPHRLGVAVAIDILDGPVRSDLTGLRPGEGLYGVELADGAGMVVLSRPARAYLRGRRTTDVEKLAWTRVLRGVVGEPLALEDPYSATVTLPEISAVFPISV